MWFFTSDHHFGHKLMVDQTRDPPLRPWRTIEEHDEALIVRWNARVRSDDVVYHLGDFALASLPYIRHVLSRLNGEIRLVPSDPGHDTHWLKRIRGEPGCPDNLKILGPIVRVKVQRNIFGLGNDPQDIILCHYPMQSWYKSGYGSLHLHGHWHGNRGVITARNRMDISVENSPFAPLLIAEVLAGFRSQPEEAE